MYDDCLATLGQAYDSSKIKGSFAPPRLWPSCPLSILTRCLLCPLPDGRFGAMMDVASVNDGPVTVLLDTREPKPPSSSSASTSSSALPTPSASTTNLLDGDAAAPPPPISKKQAKWNAKQLEKAAAQAEAEGGIASALEATTLGGGGVKLEGGPDTVEVTR